MKRTLIVTEEAKDDILTASHWYSEKLAGLDEKFITAVEKTLARILRFPEAGIKIYRSFRQTSLQKFPYVIVYEIALSSIVIYSVFHTSQNPKKKTRRLKK